MVIVIMGILATISTATFSSYFAKARDAKRISAVQSLKMLIQVDSASNWNNDRYVYVEDGASEGSKLSNLLDKNDYRMPEGENGICYIVGMATGKNSIVGDDNEFFVATWNESEDQIIVDGTNTMVTNLETADSLKKEDFTCGTKMNNVTGKFSSLAGTGDNQIGTINYVFSSPEGKPFVK